MYKYATIIIWLILETYFWYSVRATHDRTAQRKWLYFQVLSMIPMIIVLVTMFQNQFPEQGASTFSNLILGTAFSFIISKLLISFFFLTEDIGRGGIGIFRKLTSSDSPKTIPGRRVAVRNIALATVSIPFAGLIYGVFKGKYRFKVRKLTLTFPDLPAGFDGFKIAQISDVHSGSFDNTEEVSRGIQMISDENADVVLFTGDMVNVNAGETKPYVEMFKKVKAPFGKFSILGNHDYGNYYNGLLDTQKKRNNLDELKAIEKEMGFNLLLNENVSLEKNGERIKLVGVENWGHAPFPQEGDLDKALIGVSDNDFTILMSHDPTHWDDITLGHNKKVHLTLSGHTHGAQMGVEIPWLKISPARFAYPRWAGLYKEGEEHLYVNRGFGFIGYPGRVGIWPEITVIELKRG